MSELPRKWAVQRTGLSGKEHKAVSVINENDEGNEEFVRAIRPLVSCNNN